MYGPLLSVVIGEMPPINIFLEANITKNKSRVPTLNLKVHGRLPGSKPQQHSFAHADYRKNARLDDSMLHFQGLSHEYRAIQLYSAQQSWLCTCPAAVVVSEFMTFIIIII
jgi:hypothetical protein